MTKWMMFLCAAVLATSRPAAAQTVEQFYKGKDIEFISTGDAGTSYDLWARTLGRYLPKQIPGRPNFVVKNMPGAGHIRGAQYMYSVAPKDGSSIAMTSDNVAMSTVLKNKEGLDIDYSRFNLIGSTDAPNQICLARSTSKIKKAEDLFTDSLTVGGAGAGSGPTIIATYVKTVVGMKLNIVEGYKSLQEVFLAIDRGEVDGTCTSLSGVMLSRPQQLTDGTYKVLFNIEAEPVPGLNAPSIVQFGKTDEQKQILNFYSLANTLGHPVIAPPDVPKDRVQALRKAFDAVVNSPDHIADVKKQGLTPSPGTGERWEQQFAKIKATPPELLKKVAAFMGG
jgi:tripartite-type tricarboxylate transporter receptor subunit TctC